MIKSIISMILTILPGQISQDREGLGDLHSVHLKHGQATKRELWKLCGTVVFSKLKPTSSCCNEKKAKFHVIAIVYKFRVLLVILRCSTWIVGRGLKEVTHEYLAN